MASAQYNELTNDAQQWSSSGQDPMYSWNTSFPMKTSRLHCATQRRRGRVLSRCLTQPITFVEIQEAEDEESTAGGVAAVGRPGLSASKEVIWGHFEEFSRRVSSRLTRDDSADSEHSMAVGSSSGHPQPLPDSPDTATTSGNHLLQEYERRRRRSQRQKRTTSIEELPETEKGD